jgi:alpha/beta superfamily hydrolase
MTLSQLKRVDSVNGKYATVEQTSLKLSFMADRIAFREMHGNHREAIGDEEDVSACVDEIRVRNVVERIKL